MSYDITEIENIDENQEDIQRVEKKKSFATELNEITPNKPNPPHKLPQQPKLEQNIDDKNYKRTRLLLKIYLNEFPE